MRDICRTPEATPAFCTLTAFIAAVDIGDITRAIPIPIKMNGTAARRRSCSALIPRT